MSVSTKASGRARYIVPLQNQERCRGEARRHTKTKEVPASLAAQGSTRLPHEEMELALT